LKNDSSKTNKRSWMNLQARYDLEVAKDRSQDRLEGDVQVYAPV